MFHQFGEEELLIIEKPKNFSYHKQNENILSTLCGLYEQKMTIYMKSVPHMTPTLYELNVRHNKIKDVLKTQLNCLNDRRNDSLSHFVDEFEKRIENLFKKLVKENMKEYKKCQLAFIIGWKCTVNKPNKYEFANFDNRF